MHSLLGDPSRLTLITRPHWVRLKLARHQRIRDHAHALRLKLCAQHRILPPRIRHTDDRISTPQRTRQQLVSEHADRVREPEQRVVSEHCPHAEERRMVHRFVREGGERAVAVDELDAFPQDDGAEVGEEEEVVWERGGGGDGDEGDVVDLNAGREVADADARAVVVRDDDYLLSVRKRRGGVPGARAELARRSSCRCALRRRRPLDERSPTPF